MAVLEQRERAKAVADASPAALARALEEFLAEHPKAVMMEDGRVAFDMREAK